VNVGGDNCIYEFDPAAKAATGAKICPNFAVSQRGLAFNPLSDTFYSGSWNDGLLNHFDTTGKLLESINLGIGISGLAFNPTSGHLFVMTSHGAVGGLDVYVYDTNKNYDLIGGFNIKTMSVGGGAGLEIDCAGRLWAVDQVSKRVIAADSGETGACGWQDVPWLTVTPASGSLPNGTTRGLTLGFNAANLPPGTYRAHLQLGENTPYVVRPIDITLTVVNYYKVYLPIAMR
jgi:hypothetical protein